MSSKVLLNLKELFLKLFSVFELFFFNCICNVLFILKYGEYCMKCLLYMYFLLYIQNLQVYAKEDINISNRRKLLNKSG